MSTNCHCGGAPFCIGGRIGKLVEFVTACFVIAEVVGRERLNRIGELLLAGVGADEWPGILALLAVGLGVARAGSRLRRAQGRGAARWPPPGPRVAE